MGGTFCRETTCAWNCGTWIWSPSPSEPFVSLFCLCFRSLLTFHPYQLQVSFCSRVGATNFFLLFLVILSFFYFFLFLYACAVITQVSFAAIVSLSWNIISLLDLQISFEISGLFSHQMSFDISAAVWYFIRIICNYLMISHSYHLHVSFPLYGLFGYL